MCRPCVFTTLVRPRPKCSFIFALLQLIFLYVYFQLKSVGIPLKGCLSLSSAPAIPTPLKNYGTCVACVAPVFILQPSCNPVLKPAPLSYLPSSSWFSLVPSPSRYWVTWPSTSPRSTLVMRRAIIAPPLTPPLS